MAVASSSTRILGLYARVLANDRVRFSVYDEGDVYLLNTDFDVPSYAEVEKGGVITEVRLAPAELKHIKI